MKPIVVVDYDPNWAKQFEALRASLLGTIGQLAVCIEHVGSTSVHGLAAKPVIDIDIVVSAGNVVPTIDLLTTVGYEHVGDLGIPDRDALKGGDRSVAHHLYVCPTTSQALANHLAVRDYLRAHPNAVREYSDLKRRLAREYADNIDGYVEAKSEFLLGVLREVGFALPR